MTDTIRKRPDGSIDTAFYMEQGRRARAQAARILWSSTRPSALD